MNLKKYFKRISHMSLVEAGKWQRVSAYVPQYYNLKNSDLILTEESRGYSLRTGAVSLTTKPLRYYSQLHRALGRHYE